MKRYIYELLAKTTVASGELYNEDLTKKMLKIYYVRVKEEYQRNLLVENGA